MARAVDDRHDADTAALRMGDDGVHLHLGERVAIGVLVVLVVTGGEGGLHGVAVVALAVDLHRHVVQEEAHAVVGQDQLDVGIAVHVGAIDDLHDLAGREVLAAGVDREDGALRLDGLGHVLLVLGGELVHQLEDTIHIMRLGGLVAPDALHAADGGDFAARARHLVEPLGGDVLHRVVEVVAAGVDVAEHPVPCVVGVQDVETLLLQELGLGDVEAPPAGGPVGHGEVLVERPEVRLAVVVDAVVEADGLHARRLDEAGHVVGVLDEVPVRAVALDLAPAGVGEDIVGELVGAEVEVLGDAGLAEVGNVLLQDGVQEVDRLLVGDVDGAIGDLAAVCVSGVLDAEFLHRDQQGVHVARAVDDRHDAHALALRMGEDVIHLGFGERVAVGVLVVLVVTGGEGGLHGVAVVALAADLHRHVVEEEAHAVVRQDQLDVGVAVLRGAIDDLLELIGREVLASRVDREDAMHPLRSFRLHRQGHHTYRCKHNGGDPRKHMPDGVLRFDHVLSHLFEEYNFNSVAYKIGML